MSRFALPAIFATALTTLGAAAATPRVSRARTADDDARARTNATLANRASTALERGSCGKGTLPDGNACVHLPSDDNGGPENPAVSNAHHERSGRWAVYDQIPRRPERPADYDAYRYPIPPGMPGGHYVISGYDLDRPDESQRRGPTLSHVGHGGVDLPQRKGEPIKMVALEHQQGDAEVLFVGPLFGFTVLTRHTLREGGQLRDYILLFGHLDGAAPGLSPGRTLAEGELVGFVGDTGSPELVHLHLEARRVRDDKTAADLERYAKGAGGGQMMLVQNEVSVVCDPRNVLPLK